MKLDLYTWGKDSTLLLKRKKKEKVGLCRKTTATFNYVDSCFTDKGRGKFVVSRGPGCGRTCSCVRECECV